MSNAPASEGGLKITSEISNVEEGYYLLMFKELDAIAKNPPEDDAYRQTKYVIANYIYLIYERFSRLMIREIDYEKVRSWAHKNHALATYLLCNNNLFQKKTFSLEAFEKWIYPRENIVLYSMFEGWRKPPLH